MPEFVSNVDVDEFWYACSIGEKEELIEKLYNRL